MTPFFATERSSTCLLALALLVAPLAGAQDFVDVTRAAGIDFVHRSGSAAKDWISEVNGSGVALFDADGDGDLDIYFVQGFDEDADPEAAPPVNRLYENLGGWRFADVTESSGSGDAGAGSSAAVADVDNDGDLDLYVTKRGPNALYLNDGRGRFKRAVDSGIEDPSWSASASFADFDKDGLVDLYVANYIRFRADPAKKRGAPECTYRGERIFCGPGGLEPAPDRVFRNLGGGRFADASAEWGSDRVPASYALGTLALDVNRDGWIDVLVANDTKRNYCFLGGERGFTEAGVFLGLAYNDYGVEQAGMGLASADLRASGRDDIFVTNFEDDTNTLYLAAADGAYSESTYPAGLGTPSYPYLGWGCFFFDANGDGLRDLFVANGHVAPQVDRVRASIGYRQANQLFIATAPARFREDPGFRARENERKQSSRGAAFGDLDGDGDPDIVVSNIDAPPALLENRLAPAGIRWLEIRLEGTRSNRAAIGARVRLRSSDGRDQSHTVQSGSSYASQCELAARFAIETEATVTLLRVDWPSGLAERFAAPQSARTLTLVEGRGARISEN